VGRTAMADFAREHTGPEAILDDLAIARAELRQWVWGWHRAAVSGIPFPETATAEHAHETDNVGQFIQRVWDRLSHLEAIHELRRYHRILHDEARTAAQVLRAEGKIPPMQYDRFADAAQIVDGLFDEIERTLRNGETTPVGSPACAR